MCSLFNHLRHLLLLYLVFTCLSNVPQLTYAQYQYTAESEQRRRPTHLVINSIKKLRPLKAAVAGVAIETFARQRQEQQQGVPMMTTNTFGSGSFRHRLLNALEEAYFRSATQTSSSQTAAKSLEIRNALPRAVVPILQDSDDGESGEYPVLVQPTLQPSTPLPPSTTTTMITTTALPLITTPVKILERTTTPILLSRILSPNETDAARQARTQARWRKLGPLVKSVHYPYTRRNLHRIIIADTDAIRISDTVRSIVEQRLRKAAAQRAKAAAEQRPRANGILLSNAQQLTIDEWPVEKVEPTTSTASTTSMTATELDFKPSAAALAGFANITGGITFPASTTAATTITSAASAIATSRPAGFATMTNDPQEQRPFLLSTPPSDYHFRQITPARKFKFTQKLRRQPRLRIRKPGEPPGPLRGKQTASEREPLVLPQLAPLQLQNEVYNRQAKTDISIDFSSGNSALGHAGSSSDFNAAGDSGSAQVPPPDTAPSSEIELSGAEFGTDEVTSGGSGLMGFGNGRPPPVDFGEPGISVFGGGSGAETQQQPPTTRAPEWSETIGAAANMSVPEVEASTDTSTKTKAIVNSPPPPLEAEKELSVHSMLPSAAERPDTVLPKNSGLRPASPPPDFDGEFGTGVGGSPFRGTFGVPPAPAAASESNQIEESIFTGESALTPNRAGPTGDGLGPPILPGAAVPPPVPALGIGGAAAGIPPTPLPFEFFQTTQNLPTTLKPSALLSVLNKADIGFNQAISHFEQGTPVESAAIDILEVALGSEKLDSQAKLLGHIDRTIGIDNLQRLQRWANTGGALDALKEQLVKLAKNYSPPDNLLPTLPPQLQYLFAPTGKR